MIIINKFLILLYRLKDHEAVKHPCSILANVAHSCIRENRRKHRQQTRNTRAVFAQSGERSLALMEPTEVSALVSQQTFLVMLWDTV